MLDCVVIGGGPAGLSAAVYLARQKLSFALFADLLGGKAMLSSDVENYLGVHEVSGLQLVERFREHLKDYQKHFDLHEAEPVINIVRIKGGFNVVTDKGAYQTRTILIASGSQARKLNVPGEAELLGKGVTYCATCDAPLFRDKKVAVIGGGNSAMDAALFAAKYAEHVDLIIIKDVLHGDEFLKSKVLSHPSITAHFETRVEEILGDNKVSSIVIERRGESTKLPVIGVFIEVGLIPTGDFVNFVGKDEAGQIIVDKYNRTNVEGVWAAGDVTDLTEKQISVAVGEGAKAALSIIKHLQMQA